MRKTMLVAGMLLALCGSAAAAGDDAAARKARLVGNVKSFTLSLQYHGALDPKVPRGSMTLATHPIARLAIPPFNSDVVITEAQALKIIDWLEKDGFLAAAAQDVRAEYVVPCYVLQVAGGGHRLEQNLGWDLGMFKRMDALAAMTAADRVAKFKAQIDKFVLTLGYDGPAQAKPMYRLTLSTSPMEYSARSAHGLDVVVTKEAAVKLIERLEKDGFFARAGEPFRGRRKGPGYVLTLSAGVDLQLQEDLGWGDGLIARLESVRDVLDPEGAQKTGTLIATVKGVLPPPAKTPAMQERVQPEGAPLRREKRPETGLVAERKKRLIDDVDNFKLSVSLVGKIEPSPEVRILTLTTRIEPRAAWPMWHHEAVVDKTQALAIIDFLADSALLAKLSGTAAGNDNRFDARLSFRDTKEGDLETSFGWGTGAMRGLKALRAVLTGDLSRPLGASAATAMDRFLDSARTAMGKTLQAEQAAIAKASVARAAKLKADLDTFVLKLSYVGPEDKPFYWLLLSTRPQAVKHKYQYELEGLVDQETASNLIDRLAETGVLGEADDVNQYHRILKQPPAGPCYQLYVGAGEARFHADLGWNKDLADRLLGIRALLTGDAAKQMDTFLGRLSGLFKEWTGKPYEPPK